MQQSLAIAIISGLVVKMPLVLLVLPVLLMNKAHHQWRGEAGRGCIAILQKMRGKDIPWRS